MQFKWVKKTETNIPRRFVKKPPGSNDKLRMYKLMRPRCNRKLHCKALRHQWNCYEHKDTIIELKESYELECSICKENIIEYNKKFGILEKCCHVFCMTCIMRWRKSHLNNSTVSKKAARSCPMCRTETLCIISCNRLVTDPKRKQMLIMKYKRGCKNKDCKHFNFGKNHCPFDNKCLFRHTDEQGNVVANPPRPPPRPSHPPFVHYLVHLYDEINISNDINMDQFITAIMTTIDQMEIIMGQM